VRVKLLQRSLSDLAKSRGSASLGLAAGTELLEPCPPLFSVQPSATAYRKQFPEDRLFTIAGTVLAHANHELRSRKPVYVTCQNPILKCFRLKRKPAGGIG
jgi:hypothetical protein